MWTALRMFEERRNLLTSFAKGQNGKSALATMERAKASQVHIERIRAILSEDHSVIIGDLGAAKKKSVKG